MTHTAAVALFAALAVLAAVPSVSVLAVSARAAAFGFRQGAATALGIVLGDVLFILLAVFGLTLAVVALGGAVHLIAYGAGLYLLWLGVHLWRTRAVLAVGGGGSRGSAFMSGLLITLGDQKAILFYLGLLPAFVDLNALSAADGAKVIAIAVVAVGGVKLAYAWAGARIGAMTAGRAATALQGLAALVMLGVGAWLIARTLVSSQP